MDEENKSNLIIIICAVLIVVVFLTTMQFVSYVQDPNCQTMIDNCINKTGICKFCA